MVDIKWHGMKINAREFVLQPRYIRAGDFVQYQGKLCYVETVQRNIPSIHRWGGIFTMFTLVSTEGDRIPVRDMHGRKKVWRTR